MFKSSLVVLSFIFISFPIYSKTTEKFEEIANQASVGAGTVFVSTVGKRFSIDRFMAQLRMEWNLDEDVSPSYCLFTFKYGVKNGINALKKFGAKDKSAMLLERLRKKGKLKKIISVLPVKGFSSEESCMKNAAFHIFSKDKSYLELNYNLSDD